MTSAFPELFRAGQTVIVRRGDRVGMVGRVVAVLPRDIYAVATDGYLQPTHVHHADLFPIARAAKALGRPAAPSKQRVLDWRHLDRCRTILAWHPTVRPASSGIRSTGCSPPSATRRMPPPRPRSCVRRASRTGTSRSCAATKARTASTAPARSTAGSPGFVGSCRSR